MQSFLLYWLIPRIGKIFIWFIGRTLKWQPADISRMVSFQKQYGNVIYAFWHNRLILMPYLYNVSLHDSNLAVMVSQSRDGQIIAGILERFGFKAIRGSTTRGGKAALREMVKVLKSGFNGAFTPDGPRGPRYEVSPGVVVLSHLTGLPIIPACVDFSRKKVIPSWDKMIIPLPFSRAVFRVGDAIEVGMDANPNTLQEKVLEVKRALDQLADRCALDLVPKCYQGPKP